MSRLTDLIAQAKARDAQMGADLEREFKALSSRRAFGLNFERHIPETVELPQRPVRRGDKVRILRERGSTKKGDQRLWTVQSIRKAKGTQIACLELRGGAEPEKLDVAVDDLVVVAEFRDYIYPGLVSTGKVERGGGRPYHTVINGENYHVLKALSYTHRGRVDAIYIDPPYNGGAKDWKYNNDFVDKEDAYRHSKWLAFMERRLLVAKELLNPEDSVLIVTTDEKEYHRLGLLLEQIFAGQRIQMISTSINPKGTARGKEFYRVDEYIYFVYFGAAVVQDAMIPGLCITESEAEGTDEIRGEDDEATPVQPPPVRWASLLRSGAGARREDSHLKFYPVLVDFKAARIVDAGDPLPLGQHPEDYTAPVRGSPLFGPSVRTRVKADGS
jgi:adenine-specific DNA-methyltransferase